MKIEKIILRNLTSIQGEQTIDFTVEPLRSAGLFAITGDTGSGKSTILDAICLALYNKAPRFENAEKRPKEELDLMPEMAQQMQADNVAAILRRGQKEGGVCLTFSTTGNERYEAEWTIRVKKTGKYDSPKRSLKRLSPKKENVDSKDMQLRIEQVVGLTYEQFTRTVILAQNSFSNFLKAKSADKAILLEKLTGTELYGSISEQIFRMSAQADSQVQALENQMQGMLHDQLCPMALAEEQERQKLLTSQKRQTEASIVQLTRQTEWLDKFDKAAADVKSLEEDFAASTKRCTLLRADELLLERYDSLLSMQPLYQEITMRRTDIELLKKEEAELFNRLTEAEKILNDKADKLTIAHQRTEEAEKHLEARTEAIDRGHALSGEINAASEQLKQNEAQMKDAEFALRTRLDSLKNKQEYLRKIEQTVNDKQLHQQTLSAHRYMFEKFDLIKDKLSALTTETQHKEDTSKKLNQLQERQKELRTQSEKAEQQQHNLEARINTLKSELQIHRSTIQGMDSAKLQKAAAENRNRLTALQHALTLWQHISEGYANIADKIAAEKREETAIAQQKEEARKMEIALQSISETFEHINTTYTISQTQDIVKLRKQLKEGTACPVCGATHHPYHSETERELGKLLNSLDKEYIKVKEELEKKRKDLALIREEIAGRCARIETMCRSRQEMTERQTADLEEWKGFTYLDLSFRDCSSTVNREARRTMIQVLIDNASRTAEEAEKELDTYNYHQQCINTLNESVEKISTDLENNKTYLDKTTTEIHIAKVTASDLQQTLYYIDRSCTELYNDLDELITLNNWYDELRNNSDELRLRLTNMHRDWNTTCTSLEETQRAADLLREEIKGAETNVEEARRAVENCKYNCDRVRENLQNKHEEMRHLFGNSTPKQEAEFLQQTIHTARLAEKNMHQEYETMQAQLHALKGKRDNLVQTRLNNQQQLQSKTVSLDLLILRYNSTHSPVQFSELNTLFTDERDWKALRLRLNKVKDEHMLAENHLTQARQYLVRLQADPNRPKEVNREGEHSPYTILEKEKSSLEELIRQLSLCNSRLLSHENCVRRAGKLSTELEAARANATEWKRLSELFGSANGKKFRTLAQSYTFRYLVDHANYHLRMLSPRYELCNIPGTLTLEIIDHDMFDQHRYVTSLSGGETFVVSLSLALGLASLSSSNLAIGSLFIDEGFGNLDRNSLDLVMVALSNLENTQGRKVGVISHTEQIRSQISPQIIVSKKPGSNYSSIEIR